MKDVSITHKIPSIDFLRGLVMLLMALDHTRDYFHFDAFIYDPTDLEKTNVPVFLTRFITHYCAPIFCFLAGTSAFFVGTIKGKNVLSVWLIKRGLWLILAEITIVKFGWYFKLDYSFIDLAVICSLGVSMIALSGLLQLQKSVALFIGFAFVFWP